MVRPCVARRLSSWLSGLAQMYPASDWSSLLRAIMGISARAICLADRPRRGPFGSPVGAGKTDLHLSVSSRRPRRVPLWLRFHRPVPLFAPEAVPSSRPAHCRCDARRRGQGRRAAPLVFALTARASAGLGRQLIAPPQLEVAAPGEHRPGDASKLVGERDRENVVVQALLGGLDPANEPVVLPVFNLTSTTQAACTNSAHR